MSKCQPCAFISSPLPSWRRPQVLLQACKHVQEDVDAVDLNLGCPQRVAHAEHFGSYLLDEKVRGFFRRSKQTLLCLG